MRLFIFPHRLKFGHIAMDGLKLRHKKNLVMVKGERKQNVPLNWVVVGKGLGETPSLLHVTQY